MFKELKDREIKSYKVAEDFYIYWVYKFHGEK